MYSNYYSLKPQIDAEIANQQSVLNKFPEQISRSITQSCAKHLAQFTSLQLPNTEIAQRINYIIELDTIEQVNWALENLMYGLTLSHEYQDIIKDCWNVYHDWLTVLLDEPKAFIPKPIRQDALFYSKKMLWHLYNLFVPRRESNVPTKHIMMCHGVLVLLEEIAKKSKQLNRDLWDNLLKFQLAINNAVLSQIYQKEDFCDNMSSRLIGTLFEIWLIACNKCFPSACMWKTFQSMCSNWRHHMALVVEWSRVMFALTNRLLEILWWPDMANLTKIISNSFDTNVAYDIQKIIYSMDANTLIQAWFRFFHIIGNPFDFSNTIILFKNNDAMRGMENAKDFDSTVVFANYCFKKLPLIFLELIKGISQMVDLFLGFEFYTNNQFNSTIPSPLRSSIVVTQNTNSSVTSVNASPPSTTTQSSFTRIKSQQIFNSEPKKTTSQTLLNSTEQANTMRSPCLKRNRPNVDSLLHLFGNWLFEAAMIGYLEKISLSDKSQGQTNKAFYTVPTTNDKEICQNPTFNGELICKDNVLGQAEAFGILCKIFSSCKTGEKISSEYLARFYSCLFYGLKVQSNDTNENDEILSSILFNGANLFKLNLNGTNILLPSFLNAIEFVFRNRYLKREESKDRIKTIGSTSVTLVELRRQCISILSSILCLPNHYNTIFLNSIDGKQTFSSLKSRVLEIYLTAIQNESDITNLQMLFGCGRLIVSEWSSAEKLNLGNTSDFIQLNDDTNISNTNANNASDKKGYYYKQIITLICLPLKYQPNNLVQPLNHSYALSIFDTLSSIAIDSIPNEDEHLNIEFTAISWIYQYVAAQIKRPSREHSREMHSVIVAAYHCLITLMIQKPQLFKDKKCLQTISNCIEIGISGVSSYPEQQQQQQQQQKDPAVLLKTEKELKPASLKVKEAAECVLAILMEYTSASSLNEYTKSNGLLDEQVLIESHGLSAKNARFKYFALNGSIVIGLLDGVKSNSDDPSPHVLALLRGPFGRYAWSLKLRNSPLNKKPTNQSPQTSAKDSTRTSLISQSDNSNRSILSNRSINSIDVSRSSDNVPKCELSIPSLSEVATKNFKGLNKFRLLKENQIQLENRAYERACKLNMNEVWNKGISSPSNVKEFESIRVLLSHLNFASIDSTTQRDNLTEIYSFESSESLINDLKALDSMPTRIFNNCFIFYVKANQSDIKSILNNFTQSNNNLDEEFNEFVQSLGSIVDVKKHTGWTGSFESSWKTLSSIESSSQDSKNNVFNEKKHLNQLNGNEYVVYWCDILSEIAFILPNGQYIRNKETNTTLNNSNHSSSGEFNVNQDASYLSNQSLLQSDTDNQKSRVQYYANEVKLFVVWLEQIQDLDSVPTNDLIEEASSYDSSSFGSVSSKSLFSVIIFIHPLKNGLFRIIIWSNTNKKQFYTIPLVDGMVLNSRMLGITVRQTVLNIYRRRFDSENYQPPHVRRKTKITEMIKKYHFNELYEKKQLNESRDGQQQQPHQKLKKTEAEFYTNLIASK